MLLASSKASHEVQTLKVRLAENQSKKNYPSHCHQKGEIKRSKSLILVILIVPSFIAATSDEALKFAHHKFAPPKPLRERAIGLLYKIYKGFQIYSTQDTQRNGQDSTGVSVKHLKLDSVRRMRTDRVTGFTDRLN